MWKARQAALENGDKKASAGGEGAGDGTAGKAAVAAAAAAAAAARSSSLKQGSESKDDPDKDKVNTGSWHAVCMYVCTQRIPFFLYLDPIPRSVPA